MSAGAILTYTVDFSPEPSPRPPEPPRGRVPRVARVLALAHMIERLVRNGDVVDLADAARRIGVTRARVTQITGLLLLAPAIQEAILDLPLIYRGRDPVSERNLRPIAAEPDWNTQIKMWRIIMEWPPFYRTATGERFYAQRVPDLIKQLTRLNDLLERLVEAQERRGTDGKEPPCRT